MPLLRLDKVSINFGSHQLLDEIDFQIHRGKKVGLLGRNGAGKTTLLRVLAGKIATDGGERWVRPGTEIAWLDQTLPEADDRSVYDVVADGLAEVGALLKQYHQLTADFEHADMDVLARVQAQLEAKDGWSLGQKVDTVISQLQLPADKLMSQLSGGWRKRVALACALVREPDILILDEPTNHLDIPAIEWLEKQLQDFNGALLLVTHDRDFLQKITNTIVEIDRGSLFQFDGGYRKFLDFRVQRLAAEEKFNEDFDKKLAQEEVWIRQGIKARRTRNEGRVRALEALRNKRQARRNLEGSATFSVESADSSGKIVAELDRVSQSFGDEIVIEDFSTTVIRGDRIGLVGTNGAGKSTLLKILLGQLSPTSGQVKLGSKIEIAYFDQLREQLDMEKDLIDNVCGGQLFIEINGRKKHAISYLGDFLFSPERVRTPAKALSGGEQNRAILAKIFTKPANVLVFDEPTNDLDIETLELLEDILLEFKGTVLLVSHDRAFMDNVVTSLMVFEGNGKIQECVGGYADWVAKGGSLTGLQDSENMAAGKSSSTTKAASESPQKTLSYKDKRELGALPKKIEELEILQTDLEAQMGQPGFYDNQEQVEATLKQSTDIQGQLELAYARWEELES